MSSVICWLSDVSKYQNTILFWPPHTKGYICWSKYTTFAHIVSVKALENFFNYHIVTNFPFTMFQNLPQTGLVLLIKYSLKNCFQCTGQSTSTSICPRMKVWKEPEIFTSKLIPMLRSGFGTFYHDHWSSKALTKTSKKFALQRWWKFNIWRRVHLK